MTVTALRPADDVVAMLRKLADGVEAGDIIAPWLIVVVPSTCEEPPMLFGYGPERYTTDRAAVYFELAVAQRAVMEVE